MRVAALLASCLLVVAALAATPEVKFTPLTALQCVFAPSSPNGSWQFVNASSQRSCIGSVAYGYYNASRFLIGWDQLDVATNSSFDDKDQAYAAGYFEGAATVGVVQDFYANMIAPNSYNNSIADYFEENFAWMTSESERQQNLRRNRSGPQTQTEQIWVQVALLLRQFQGFLDGLNSAISNPAAKFTRLMLLMTSSQGDLSDLTNKFPFNGGADWRSMQKHEFELWFGLRTHCSAIIRIPDDLSDIYVAHATWQSFSFALRIYKTLTLRFSSAKAQTIQFSSYPATFVSTDDFHLLDTGLTVIETSLSVFNMSIYEHVQPQGSLLSWIRTMVANRLAADGASWASLFSQYNSGTYNNEWVVVDFNRFQPFNPNPPANGGVLTVLNQLPGLIVSGDVTTLLYTSANRTRFWPSYNVPYFASAFEYGGYPEAVILQGPQMLDYNTCVRAQIFQVRAPGVQSLAQLEDLIQYNDYQHDPISAGNPLYAIASRVDLTPSSMGGPQAFGAFDAKYTSNLLFAQGQRVRAFSGPTPQQPTFSFASTNATLLGPHAGLPETFDFKFQVFTP